MEMNQVANNLPIDLVLVRHGRSHENEAYEASLAGDASLYTDDFRRTPSRAHRLTQEGIKQAKSAGAWLNKEFSDGYFQRYFVSTYDRAQQTAGHLAIVSAQWEIKRTLVERSWGDYGHIPLEEQLKKYAQRMERDKADAFFSRPPNGDSLNDICDNIGAMLMSWRLAPVGERVIMVTHGEVMTCMRYVLEHLDHYKWYDLMRSSDPKDKIHNTQILHYTRQNPADSEDIQDEFRWTRSVCPWNTELSSNNWRQIEQPAKYQNAELLERVIGDAQ
jgi:broad specificity phosphatase PhoE